MHFKAINVMYERYETEITKAAANYTSVMSYIFLSLGLNFSNRWKNVISTVFHPHGTILMTVQKNRKHQPDALLSTSTISPAS